MLFRLRLQCFEIFNMVHRHCCLFDLARLCVGILANLKVVYRRFRFNRSRFGVLIEIFFGADTLRGFGPLAGFVVTRIVLIGVHSFHDRLCCRNRYSFILQSFLRSNDSFLLPFIKHEYHAFRKVHLIICCHLADSVALLYAGCFICSRIRHCQYNWSFSCNVASYTSPVPCQFSLHIVYSLFDFGYIVAVKSAFNSCTVMRNIVFLHCCKQFISAFLEIIKGRRFSMDRRCRFGGLYFCCWFVRLVGCLLLILSNIVATIVGSNILLNSVSVIVGQFLAVFSRVTELSFAVHHIAKICNFPDVSYGIVQVFGKIVIERLY